MNLDPRSFLMNFEVPANQTLRVVAEEELQDAVRRIDSRLEALGVTTWVSWSITAPEGYTREIEGRVMPVIGYGSDLHPGIHDDFVDWVYFDPDGRIGCATCDRQIVADGDAFKHVHNDSPRCWIGVEDSPLATPQDDSIKTHYSEEDE